MIDVIFVYRTGCPHCARLLPIVEKICNMLGLPLYKVHIDQVWMTLFSRPFQGEVLDLDTGERRRIDEIFYYQLSSATPQVIVRLHGTREMKEIIIVGGTKRQDLEKYEIMLYTLLRVLKDGVEKVLTEKIFGKSW